MLNEKKKSFKGEGMRKSEHKRPMTSLAYHKVNRTLISSKSIRKGEHSV